MSETQVLRDHSFKKGFTILYRDHPVRETGALLPSPDSGEKPDWRLVQWMCESNLAAAVPDYTDGYCLTTDSQTAGVSGDGTLLLELRASREYSHPRLPGEAWPHLLIEQQIPPERCPPLGGLRELRLRMEARIPYWEEHEENPDPSLHTGQTNLYFTVGKTDGSGDYYWFGVPIFDARFLHQEGYSAEDGGKEDATHKLIYTTPQREFTAETFHDGNWIRYDRDILPLLADGLREAVEKGFLSDSSLDDYRLTSTNLGWEMPGSYDAALEVRELSLTAIG